MKRHHHSALDKVLQCEENKRNMNELTDKFFLDIRVQACREKVAALVNTRGETTNQIRVYSPLVDSLTETECEKRNPEPIGKGNSTGSKMDISGLTFTYEPQDSWLWESPTCRIEVLPRTDRKDIEALLETLRPIQKNILSRGIAGPKITFQIGIEQPEKNNPWMADSIAAERLIRFPTSANNSRLVVVGTAQGAEIPLQGILLHGIGHILAPLLSREIKLLERTLEKNITKITEHLQSMSARYLEAQSEAVQEGFLMLENGVERGLKRIEINNYKNQIINHFIQELFAKLVRELYLEPCLLQSEPKTHRKSGWDEFDTLCNILAREVRFTLRKDAINTPLFPEKRETPTIQHLGPIQDLSG